MPASETFLIIDDNADSRFLLTKTLMRKFPAAVLIECGDEGTAISAAADEKLDAIVMHRTGTLSGVEMIPLLRRANPRVPIVMVSGIDRSVEANKAGADYFLHYDEWLRIGTIVAGLLTFKRQGSLAPFRPEEPDPTLSTL